MSPRKVDKEQKKREILKAALEVIARQGIFNFKMIDIAEKAGIGKGTLYEYFPSKEELISGCFGLHMDLFERILRARIESLSQPVDKIKAIIELSFDYFAANQTILNTMFDFWALSRQRKDEKPILIDFNQLYRTYAEFLSGILDEGIEVGQFKPIDTGSVASAIIAVLDGIMFQAVLGVIDINDKSIPEKLNKMFLEGILK